MKLSVEAKIAAAVAAAFVAVTVGSVVAQGSGAGQVAGPNQSSDISSLGVHSSVSQETSAAHDHQQEHEN